MTETVAVSKLQVAWQADVDEYVSAMALHETMLAVGTADGTLYGLDPQTGQQTIPPMPLLPMSITQLAWSGKRLAVAGQDRHVCVWSPDGSTLKRPFGKSWVEHLAWHPTEPWLLIGAEKQVVVWDVAADALIYTYDNLPRNVMGLAWHPALPRQFAVTCGDTLVRLDMGKPAPIRQFHWGALLFGLHWSPDGQVMATSTHDNGLHVWYAKTGNDLHMSGYPSRIQAMAWQPDSRFLATAGDSDITIWDFAGKGPAGSMPVILGAHEGKVNSLAYCGIQLASGDLNGQVFIWLPPEQPGNDLEAPLWAYPVQAGIAQLLYPYADVVYVGADNGLCLKLTTPTH